MFGTYVNTAAIIVGSIIGIILKGGIPQRYTTAIMQAISLAILLIGIKMALKSDDIMLMIFSLAFGSIIGELLKIEEHLEKLGKWLESKLSGRADGFSKGFVTATLIFCVGSMAIVGSLESGLTGNHQTLFAKSMLDGISSIIFASSLGIGVMFSAFSVLVYQGIITLSATLIKPFLIPSVITQMSAVGGLLITAISINILEIKRIKVGNMLPAIFIPLIYFMITVAMNRN